MPSYYESLSMVALEAWALGKPVLANGQCDVLRGQCIRSNAGLYYENYAEFVEAVRVLDGTPHVAATLGQNGSRFFRSTTRGRSSSRSTSTCSSGSRSRTPARWPAVRRRSCPGGGAAARRRCRRRARCSQGCRRVRCWGASRATPRPRDAQRGIAIVRQPRDSRDTCETPGRRARPQRLRRQRRPRASAARPGAAATPRRRPPARPRRPAAAARPDAAPRRRRTPSGTPRPSGRRRAAVRRAPQAAARARADVSGAAVVPAAVLPRGRARRRCVPPFIRCWRRSATATPSATKCSASSGCCARPATSRRSSSRPPIRASKT